MKADFAMAPDGRNSAVDKDRKGQWIQRGIVMNEQKSAGSRAMHLHNSLRLALAAALATGCLLNAEASTAPSLSLERTPAVVANQFTWDGQSLHAPRGPVSPLVALEIQADDKTAESLCKSRVSVVGPVGAIAVRSRCDKVRHILTVQPQQDLLPGADYTLFLRQPAHRQAAEVVSFATRALPAQGPQQVRGSGLEEWTPRTDYAADDWRLGTETPYDPALEPKDLAARRGHTALAGHLERFNGQPIAGAEVSIGQRKTRTDAQGRFLLDGLKSGAQILKVDATKVWIDGGHYTKHFIAVTIAAKRTNRLARPVFLARIDPATEVSIASPTDREVVLTHPKMPGLEVRIPKGIVLREYDGHLVTKVSLTPVPIDRAPYPVPANFSAYFTLQPGGAFVDGDPTQSVKVVYPNYRGLAPATTVAFWNYDAGSGWKVYGSGKVSADGKAVVADNGIGFRQIMTFGYALGTGSNVPTNGPVPCGTNAGDPVCVATGLFLSEQTDLAVNDVVPIAVTRTYQQMDTVIRAFGVGRALSYDMRLYQCGANACLVLADGSQVVFANVSGTLYRAAALGGPYFNATIDIDATTHEWILTFRDKSTFYFAPHDPNQLLRMVDPNGNLTTITRSGGVSGNITQVTSPAGRFVQFTYTGNVITQATDNAGRKVTYSYDPTGSYLMSVAAADQAGVPVGQQALLQYTYDANGRQYQTIDQRGVTVLTNLYNSAADGRIKSETLGDGTTWTYTYAPTNQTGTNFPIWTQVTNPRGYTTQYWFNSFGYVTQETVGINVPAPYVPQTYILLRDPATNSVTNVIDPLQRETSISYDAHTNLQTVTRLANSATAAVTTTLDYDPSTDLLKGITDEAGANWQLYYNSASNLVGIQDPLIGWTGIDWNAFGQPTTITDPSGHTTTYKYNVTDLSSITDALNRSVQVTTDEVGRINSVTDTAYNQTLLVLDPNDNLAEVDDPLLNKTTLVPNAVGDPKSLTLPGQTLPYSFGYDAGRRLNSFTDPLQRQSTATYDGNGNPIQVTDAKQQTTTFHFDPFDRPAQIDFADGSSIKYSFDDGNRLTQVVDSVAGTINIAPDDFDHVTQVATPYGNIGYQFDSSGRILALVYPSGLTVSYAYYEPSNRLLSMTVGTDNPYVVSYEANGRVNTINLPNGVTRRHRYNDPGDQLTAIEYSNGAQILGDWSYGYDTAGRLQTAGGSFFTPLLSNALTASFDAANQLTSANGSVPSFDANGAMMSDGANSFGYDARGRLTSVTTGGQTTYYVINAFGQRDTKTLANGSTTHYLYDLAGHLIAEVDAIGATQREYVWLGDLPVMLRNHNADGTVTEYNVYTDQLNTPRIVTDQANAIVWRWDSDPYGNGPANGNPQNIAGANFVFNLRFPGQYFDAESGLHYNMARDYDPKTGRYVESDPIGLDGGINTYAYVNGNPVGDIDPTGEIAWGLAFAVANFGWQMYQNGGNIGCVNWTSVGLSMLGGGLTNGLLSGAFRFKSFGSNTWNATRSWMNRQNILTPAAGQQRHHWLFQQNQGLGQYVPNAIKNQPWNINPVSAQFNNWMGQGAWRSALGAPSWAVQSAAGGAMAVGGSVAGSNCGCN